MDLQTIKQAKDSATRALDDSLASASDAVKSTTATARAGAEHAYDHAQTFIDTGIAHAQHAEQLFFSKLKEGVEYAAEHSNASLAAAGVLAAVALPGPRRFLLRQTLGRFRSEEAVFKASESRAASLADSLRTAAGEAAKLEERRALAAGELARAHAKLAATSRQLQALSGQVSRTRKSAQALAEDLRYLPSRQALALRSEVAQTAAAARKQQAALEDSIYNLTKQGF